MSIQPVEPELYSLSDTAVILALSEATLYRMRKAGTLAMLRIGGRVLIEREEINRLKTAAREAATCKARPALSGGAKERSAHYRASAL